MVVRIGPVFPERTNPGLITVLEDTYNATITAWSLIPDDYVFPWSNYEEVKRHWSFPTRVMLVIFVMALAWTALRWAMTEFIFKPWAHWMQLTPVNIEKLPESCWKFLYYFFISNYQFYVCCYVTDMFWRPDMVWKDFSFDAPIPDHLHMIYMIQTSFYFHMTYATIYMDHKRKDTNVMIAHHVIFLSLCIFSYGLKYVHVGILPLVVCDVNDWLLEFTKINVYLKRRGGKFHKINDLISTGGFLVFVLSWGVMRIYLYPVKVLHGCLWGQFVSSPIGPVPLGIFLSIQLWMMYPLFLYWFYQMVVMVFKVIFGLVTEVDDVREDDIGERIAVKNPNHRKAGAMDDGKAETNGHAHTNGDVVDSNENTISSKKAR